jgi:hypothetical protein
MMATRAIITPRRSRLPAVGKRWRFSSARVLSPSWERNDVVAGIAQGTQRFAFAELYRLIEFLRPGHTRYSGTMPEI